MKELKLWCVTVEFYLRWWGAWMDSLSVWFGKWILVSLEFNVEGETGAKVSWSKYYKKLGVLRIRTFPEHIRLGMSIREYADYRRTNERK